MRESEIERVNINNYTVSTSFSREFYEKGGVMILNQKELTGKRVVVPEVLLAELLEEKQFEFCATLYVLSKFKFMVVGLYRTPDSDTNIFIDKLSILIDYLDKKCDKIIWAGDININVLKKYKDHDMLKNVLQRHDMRYLVQFPTRVTEKSETAIDNFLIKNRSFIVESVTGVITLLSDHDGQLLEIKIPEKLPHLNSSFYEYSRNFSKDNLSLFSNLLEKETWQDVYFAQIEQKYTVFQNTLKFYFEQAFPKRRIKKTRKKNAWISNQLREEKSALIKLNKAARLNKNPEQFLDLKTKSLNLKKHITKVKQEFIKEKINSSNNIPKTVWNIINSEIGNKTLKRSENINIEENGQVYSNPQVVSNIFNNYFVNIIKDKIRNGIH